MRKENNQDYQNYHKMEIDTDMSYVKNGVLTVVNSNGLTIKNYKMIHPMSHNSVICNHCDSVYDIKKVRVRHRYNDCTEFVTPCCNYEHADDRKIKSKPDFEKLTFKLYH